ncbi:unnamed protein product [Ectocarpus sp. 12 AP-2014]
MPINESGLGSTRLRSVRYLSPCDRHRGCGRRCCCCFGRLVLCVLSATNAVLCVSGVPWWRAFRSIPRMCLFFFSLPPSGVTAAILVPLLRQIPYLWFDTWARIRKSPTALRQRDSTLFWDPQRGDGSEFGGVVRCTCLFWVVFFLVLCACLNTVRPRAAHPFEDVWRRVVDRIKRLRECFFCFTYDRSLVAAPLCYVVARADCLAIVSQFFSESLVYLLSLGRAAAFHEPGLVKRA